MPPFRRLNLVRVLLVHSELAPRLALRAILEAGGYAVEVAAAPGEAVAKLDSGQYELVLSGATVAPNVSGRLLLAYARMKDYRPATAVVTSDHAAIRSLRFPRRREVAIRTENVPTLLAKVAELVGVRASRRSRRNRRTAR